MAVYGSDFTGNAASFEYGGAGGGIANFNVMNVQNCVFTNNSATNYGGGISNVPFSNVTTPSTVAGSVFIDNHAAYSGGGVYNNIGVLRVTGGVFVGNSTDQSNYNVSDWGGGAIANVTTILISKCVFADNSSSTGGAVWTSSATTVTDSVFSESSGAMANGGNVDSQEGDSTTISDCLFFNDTAITSNEIYSYNTITVA